jgi:alpha-L-arabinofuranosidase
MTSPVRIVVDSSRVTGPVNRLVFGQNVEWEHMNHPAVWDGEKLSTDLITNFKSLGATSLRFPGGGHGDLYHWRRGVGPREQRQPIMNGFKREEEFPLFGTDELIELSQAIGAEPWMQTNPIGASAEDMVEWAQYCADAGKPIQHWELGNEVYLADPDKDDGFREVAIGPREYVRRAKEHLKALRTASPDAEIGVVGGIWTYVNYSWPPNSDGWNEYLLENMAAEADFLAIHTVYGPIVAAPDFWADPSDEDMADVIRSAAAGGLFARNSLDINLDLVDSFAPDKHVKLAVTEWLPWFGVVPDAADVSGTMGAGLYTAGVLNVMLREPRVMAAHYMAGCSPSYGGAVVPGEQGTTSSVNHAILSLYAGKIGREVVESKVEESPTYSVRAMGVFPEFENVPMVDALATRSGSSVTLFLVNRDLDNAVDVQIEAGSAAAAPSTTIVSAEHPLAINSPVLFNQRLRAQPLDAPIAPRPGPSGWSLSLPACSVTAVEWSNA